MDKTVRPSFELLMKAQEVLGDARDAEQKAGNLGAAMVINDLVLSLFKMAMDDQFDSLADRVYAARYSEQQS